MRRGPRASPDHAGYELLASPLVNVEVPPTMFTSLQLLARGLWYVVTGQQTTFKRALVAATYTNSKGLFYGGRKLATSHEVLRKFLASQALKAIFPPLTPFHHSSVLTTIYFSSKSIPTTAPRNPHEILTPVLVQFSLGCLPGLHPECKEGARGGRAQRAGPLGQDTLMLPDASMLPHAERIFRGTHGASQDEVPPYDIQALHGSAGAGGASDGYYELTRGVSDGCYLLVFTKVHRRRTLTLVPHAPPTLGIADHLGVGCHGGV